MDATLQKLYVSPDELLEKSFELGKKVLESGFKPTFVVSLWRGGAPVGIALQEYLKVHGVPTDHIAIRTSSYVGTEQASIIRVHGLEYITKVANEQDSILLVDDLVDTGRSIKAVLDKLQRKMRKNTPRDIRIATVFYKPKKSKTNIVPDFYCETTDLWISFSHELEGMTREEIAKTKGEKIAALMKF